MYIDTIYYDLKPVIPRQVQVFLRRLYVLKKLNSSGEVWPICESAGKVPDNWEGWPDNKRFAFVITHDVETSSGVSRCDWLAGIDAEYGFKSSFNFVPLRYKTPVSLRNNLQKAGFEVGVHDLYHDGKLYRNRDVFVERAAKINQYLKSWDVKGFRSGAMHHNLEWICDLNIEYDASTYDTDPFEPVSDGRNTIFPEIISFPGKHSYVELPYTLPQDFTLFVLMKHKTIDIWQRKLDWVVKNGGMALFIVHPDYLNPDRKPKYYEYSNSLYRDFLSYVKNKYAGQYYNPLPVELAHFWKKRVCQTVNETAFPGR